MMKIDERLRPVDGGLAHGLAPVRERVGGDVEHAHDEGALAERGAVGRLECGHGRGDDHLGIWGLPSALRWDPPSLGIWWSRAPTVTQRPHKMASQGVLTRKLDIPSISIDRQLARA